MLRWICSALGRMALSHAPGDANQIRLAWRQKSCARIRVPENVIPAKAGIYCNIGGVSSKLHSIAFRQSLKWIPNGRLRGLRDDVRYG